MIKLLVLTTLYPNEIRFRHGVFVETRLRHLLSAGGFEAKVIAPVPWFPFNGSWLKRYAQYASVPRLEERHGISVYHPRYLVIPKIGMSVTPFFLALSSWLQVRRLKSEGYECDLIDAHYFYPDGVAAAAIAKLTRKPLVITARGTDINLLPDFRLPRRMIDWAAGSAGAVVAVSDALRQKMLSLGHDMSKIKVLRNGVDLEKFSPKPGKEVRTKLGLNKTTLCSVGNLVELKGHELVIRALVSLPECELLIVGDGELRSSLEKLAAALAVGDRVRFFGAVEQEQLVEIYSASDILVLASSREGLPNVVLEAMACDTPVVATTVGGVPEVVSKPAAGLLVQNRSAESIAETVKKLLDNYPAEGVVRAHATQFSWTQTIMDLGQLLKLTVK